MKSITEQLDDHFGPGQWEQIREGNLLADGNMCVTPSPHDLVTVDIVANLDDWTRYYTFYRAKPKPEPKQSEKFWIVVVDGVVHSHETHFLAKEEAQRLALHNGIDYFTFEAVGIARAPKAVEYEKL